MIGAIVDYRKNPNVAISRKDQVKIIKDLKESHPLQVAEFALATGIANEPVFNWWVTWVLKKRDHGQAKVLDATSRPISLGLSTPKLWIRLTRLTRSLVLPFGMMQLNWR
ncbi:hypothetical protein ACHAW6_003172 [Cyclotella cf. meneghiniana]